MASALIKLVCVNSCLRNMCNSFPAFSLGPTPLRRVLIGFSSPVTPTQIFVQYPIIPRDIFGIQHPVYTFSLESCPRFALKSRILSCQIIQIPGPEKPIGDPLYDPVYNYGEKGPILVSGKLPTYPSPKPSFCPKWEVSVNVSLGEG